VCLAGDTRLNRRVALKHLSDPALKPADIVLTADGSVKNLDCRLAPPQGARPKAQGSGLKAHGRASRVTAGGA
jgi:hypothetical protein